MIGGLIGLLIAAVVYHYWRPGLAYVIAGVSLTLASWRSWRRGYRKVAACSTDSATPWARS